ncbi:MULTISPECIES: hypothetical protein [Bacillus]|uniref:DUF3899 domain-containing protein n=1 Tax=Bacillus stercoris TaxID=2054641 RepID=A0ABU0V704_9BACI|nr:MULTISPECIES: hypothetical protein [Bacillus]ARV97885.1 hypothetical protein S101444_01036 [Bacillus subtilis subsp. subtilis]ARW01964.1 hypothetical protein S100757_01032 [Bacillus subtilis subsp. subtilis]ASB56367.1 hypothetical protein S100761_01037 [Bacillus subtilis subsp. subtilis]MBY0126125.1 hypothetical protein [Bacillus subtilis]MCA0105959.1 hypothetical protein [Bacillus subtilis]
MDEEKKIRYLEMIQNIITRMASNSFLIKGWTVTIVVGLLAFANFKEMNSKFIIVALIPVLFFWGLDGFYLYQEKLFRKLYEDVIDLQLDEVNFSMKLSDNIKNEFNWWNVTISKTLLPFYLPVIAVILIALLIPMI